MKKLLTIEEAAAQLGLSPATLRDWRLDRKNLPFVDMDGSVRVDQDDLDAYVERCKVQPEAVVARKKRKRNGGG